MNDPASGKHLFAVVRSRGPAWDATRAMDRQHDWAAHARFMNDLVTTGFVVLGGPLDATPDVLLIVRARDEQEIRRRLAADPWSESALLVVSRVAGWTLRLGSLDLPS